MIRLHLYLLALVLLLLSAFMASTEAASSGSTIPAAPPPALGENDQRLAQKVSLETWHTPLKAILAELSRKTGVTLNCGYNKNDWQVRDRKMNILVRDVSILDLMNSIASVMKFQWSVNNEDNPTTYRLCVDRAVLLKLQTETARREAEFKAEERRRRTGLVEDLARVADFHEADLRLLRQSNPYLYLCAKTGFAEFLTQMFSEDRRFRDTFINADRNLIPKMTVLSPGTRQLCADVIREAYPIDRLDHGRGPLPDDIDKIISERSVHMQMIPRNMEWNFRIQLQDLGSITTNLGSGTHYIGWLRDPNAKSTQLWADYILKAADGTMDIQDYYNHYRPEGYEARREDSKQIEYYFAYDPEDQHSDEPELHRKIQIKMTDEIAKLKARELEAYGSQAIDRINYQTDLRLLSSASGLNIVSDSFAVVAGQMNLINGERELVEVLADLVEKCRCNWKMQGSTLEVCRRDWFRRRNSQIPDEWIAPWREEVKRTGTGTLDMYCQMAALRDEQIEENISSDPLLSPIIGDWWSYGNNQGFAKFYQQLNDQQQKLIFTKPGLALNMLSPMQYPYYAQMFHYGSRHTWDTEEFNDPGSKQVRIRGGLTTQKDGSLEYWFQAELTRPDGSTKEEIWQIPIPINVGKQ